MFFQYRVSSSLIDAFLSYWEEEMAFVLPVWACIKKWWNTELESCLSLIHAKWRIFCEGISLDCFETCWRRTMYIHSCISFIRLYYKYLHFFYKSGYITYIYTVLIYFYPRVQSIASFLTFFSLYHLNMKSKEKFPVDCHCKVNMFGCDIFYRISYLLLTV